MIIYNALGHSTNGEVTSINLDEPQIDYLQEIIQVYREQLCSSRQDIRECGELLEIFGKKITPIEINERQIFNLLQIVDGYKDEMCRNIKSKRECKKLIKLIKKQAK